MKKPGYVKDKMARDTLGIFYYKSTGDTTSKLRKSLQPGLVRPFGFIRLPMTAAQFNLT